MIVRSRLVACTLAVGLMACGDQGGTKLRDSGLVLPDVFCLDNDADGFGGTGSCSAEPAVDCDDGDPLVFPGAPERCNGADDSCDGHADEGLSTTPFYADLDGDGFGGAQLGQSCQARPAGTLAMGGDCDDSNPAVKPGAPEVCNGADDDCDALPDDGLTLLESYPDSDGDGFGLVGAPPQRSCQLPSGRVADHSDCDDTRSAAHPGATELCNGLDDNCAGGADEGLSLTHWYADVDQDSFGAGAPVSACTAPTGRVASDTDCNDAAAGIHPGAVELCNGVDEDCDLQVDEGTAAASYYPDLDADGFGAAGSTAQQSCTVVPGKVTNDRDCNDGAAAIRPSAVELCNGVDDNCAAGADEGLTFLSYFSDLDLDGYGAAGSPGQSACAAVPGKVSNQQDCNDTNNAIHPGAAEVCNGLDENCAGGVDEGLPTQNYYLDGDSDGFGAATGAAQASCVPLTGQVANHLDCNDASGAINPAATESCNSVDDDCDGSTDEGNPGGGAACSTGQSGVCAAGTATCAAGSVGCQRNVAPSLERCNTLDDDCNGQTDEAFALGTSCTSGLGVCARSGLVECDAAQTGTKCSAVPGNPTAAACDGLDNDCDGAADEPALSQTAEVSTFAWQDLEVQPYYYSASSCAGGVNGAGTDDRVGGALAMAVGGSGIHFQALSANGAPTGGSVSVSTMMYSDIAFAQAGDGYVIAGVWQVNDAEIDLYYVDSQGFLRTFRYTEFRLPAGCSGAACHTLDSLRVVRGNGARVTLYWRENTVGVRMAQVEACNVSGIWELRAPGCASTVLTPVTLVASADVLPGLGADSSHLDWLPTETCDVAAQVRWQAIVYRPSAHALAYFQVTEDGNNRTADWTVFTAASPRTLAEPEISFFQDGVSAGQYVTAWVTKDPSTPDADLNYWLTNDPIWHYAYVQYATQAGVNSISRPRLSVTTSRIWMSALRSLRPDEEPSTFKRQAMIRQTDLVGNRLPLSEEVEQSPTTGSCTDAACRPGDKGGFTSLASFGRVYFSGTGSAPSGSYASTLTCQ